MKKVICASAVIVGLSIGFSYANADIETQTCSKDQPIGAQSLCATVPAGTILPFAGSTAPQGYLLCDGSAVDRSTYATLFGVIQTTYGSGDGSSTFNVPDLRGRVAVGKDDMGGSASGRMTAAAGVDGLTLGASGGTALQTLTAAQMPSHTHTIVDPGHSHLAPLGGTFVVDHVGGTLSIGTGPFVNNSTSNQTTTSFTGITINPSGGDQPHSTVQPSMVLNYIIKY